MDTSAILRSVRSNSGTYYMPPSRAKRGSFGIFYMLNLESEVSAFESSCLIRFLIQNVRKQEFSIISALFVCMILFPYKSTLKIHIAKVYITKERLVTHSSNHDISSLFPIPLFFFVSGGATAPAPDKTHQTADLCSHTIS